MLPFFLYTDVVEITHIKTVCVLTMICVHALTYHIRSVKEQIPCLISSPSDERH